MTVAAVDTEVLDRAIAHLREHADSWARTGSPARLPDRAAPSFCAA